MTDRIRVLVTGAAGQVGRALAAAMPAGDVDAMFTTRSDLDIQNRASVDRVIADFGPDVIVNAAAYTAVDRAESDETAAFSVNAAAPAVLAEAAAELGRGRLIQISTDFVFDGAASRPYVPASPTSPLGVYGRSKLAGERAVLERLQDRAVVLRTSWVYAATGTNFALTMLRLLRERGHVRVVADQIGTPTSARSVAAAVWAAVVNPSFAGIHHWTDFGVASWYDFAVAVAEEAACRGLLPEEVRVEPIATADYPTPARRPSYSVLDKSETIRELGLAPRHWRAELRSVIEEIVRA